MQVSVSQFVPTLDNVQLARSRSDASSTIRIASGETLVIGGLMAEQSAKSIVGVPGARSIPGLGFLFGARKESDVERRLLVYITPYVWEPGMATPNDAQADMREFLDNQTRFDRSE
jgi:type II secretory pathway component GspD/PulD (secretin)